MHDSEQGTKQAHGATSSLEMESRNESSRRGISRPFSSSGISVIRSFSPSWRIRVGVASSPNRSVSAPVWSK